MSKPILVRKRGTGLKPGALFMGVAGFMVVGLGMVAALNLSQMSADNSSQAAGPKACTAAGGVVEKVKGKRTGYCLCPTGERVMPNQRCAGVATDPVFPGVGKPDASPMYDDGGVFMSPSPMYDGGGKVMRSPGVPVTRPYEPLNPISR